MNFSTICILVFGFFNFLCQFNAEIDVPLPDDLEPLNYELILLTHVESSTPKFEGCVHILIQCVKLTNKITLNQKNLSLKTDRVRVWQLTDEGEERIAVKDHEPDSDYELDRYTIHLKDYLQEKKHYKVTIDFSKNYSSKISAYNQVPYKEEHLNPDVQYMTYTRMNEIDARTIFPHFDNLNQKVTINMKIAHDETVKAITNSEFVDSKQMDYPSGWVMEEFEEIRYPMSTFSLGLAVVDFKSIIENVPLLSLNGSTSYVEIRVSAEKNVLKYMKETLRVTAKIFTFFSKFFVVPVDFKKLDFVVLPDSRVDVLGYYGLIYLGENEILKAFRKTHFKFSPVRYLMASKICHAVSAQWIGHFATMSRWNDTWWHVGLNKFLEKFCVEDLFQSWAISVEQTIIFSFLALLQTEERGRFSPIVPVGDNFAFDQNVANSETISKVHYTIRMLDFILKSGEKNLFLHAIKTYVLEFEWKNSSLHQVWDFFASTAGKKILPEGITVQQIVESWLGNKGHPLINVSRDVNSNKIIVTQEPFDSSNESKVEDDQPCWIIPVRYSIKSDSNEFKKARVRDWLKCDGKPLEIHVENGDWILFNLNLHVLARVSYDFDNWYLIEELLMDKKQYAEIELSARMHLISDIFALAEADKMRYESVFNKIKYLTHENSHKCWQLAYEEIMKIRSRWLGTKLHEPFQKYILSIVRPIFDAEFNSIEEFIKSKRRDNLFEIIIVKIMCTFEDPECQEFGEKILENWMNKIDDKIRNIIPESLIGSIYCQAIKNANVKKWDFLATNSALTDDIMNALGCSADEKILRKLLLHGTFAKRGVIRPLFCFKVFNSLLLNKLGYPIIDNFLYLGSKNLSILLQYQGTEITIDDIFAKVYEAVKTKNYLKRLDSSYSKVGARKVEESRFKAVKNISWLEKYEADLLKYFDHIK